METVRSELEGKCSLAKQHYEETLAQISENLTDSQDCYTALSTYKDTLVSEVAGLKETIRLQKLQKLDNEDHIRHLKGTGNLTIDLI